MRSRAEDAKRFRTQFENAIDCENYNKGQWSGGDVLMVSHEYRSGNRNCSLYSGICAIRTYKALGITFWNTGVPLAEDRTSV